MLHRIFAALALASASVTLSAQTTPGFELVRNTATIKNAGTIVQGDFNNDGKPDVVIGGGATTPWELTLRLGNGDGTFQPDTVIATTNNIFVLDLAAVDLNRDGNLDLVAVLQDVGFEVWYGNGNGTFQTGVFYATSTGPLTVAAGDFNGDGLPDIAIGDDSGNVEIWNNTGGKSFGLTKTISVSGPLHLLKLRAADLNGNGVTDLVAFNSGAVWALWGDGQDGFTVDQLKTYLVPMDMNVGDLNGDGRDDIIVSYDCDVSLSGPSAPCLAFDAWYGQGNQKLFYRQIIHQTSGVAPGQIWVADVNGDGLGDIVGITGIYLAAPALTTWLGKPDGSFYAAPNPLLYASYPTNLTYNPYVQAAMVPGDFNRDGMIDFIATVPFHSATETFINTEHRTLCGPPYSINDSVTVCAPVDHTYLPTSFMIQAAATDSNPITALQQYINGKLVASTTKSSFAPTFYNYSPGAYFFVTKAWDSTGLSFRADRHVTVFSGTPYPTCPVTSGNAAICLAQGATSAPVHIMANGYAPGIPTAAQLYIDGTLVVNNDNCDASGNCQGGTTLIDLMRSFSPGAYQLVYKLWDANGDVEETQTTLRVPMYGASTLP